MPRSRILTLTSLVILCVGIKLSISRAFSQSVSARTASSFSDFFSHLATASGVGGSRGEANYIKLMESIGTMTPAEIADGIVVLGQQIDSTAEPQDRLAKADAANLLMLISWRPDGAELLASQIDRLSSMLNDPSHSMSGPATLTLQSVGARRPDLVVPVLEAALKHPEVNNATSVGPSIAITLLRMLPASNQAIDDVVQYMRRQDLTNVQLVKTIVGLESSRVIPDALTAELVKCLDRPDESIKSRALVGIAKSSSAARDAARMRVQKMANDPLETAHVRRLAAEALEGRITENPESGK